MFIVNDMVLVDGKVLVQATVDDDGCSYDVSNDYECVCVYPCMHLMTVKCFPQSKCTNHTIKGNLR